MSARDIIQTKIGFGPKVKGEAMVLGAPGDAVDSYKVSREMAGKVLVVLSPVVPEFLEKAVFVGAVAVVTPAIHYRDFLRFQEGGELTLLVLLKFGNLELPEEMAKKLAKLQGETVEVDGEEKTLSLG